MKAHSENESTFRKWKHFPKKLFETVQTVPNQFCFTKRARWRTLSNILCPYYYYIHWLLWMAATAAAAVALLVLLLKSVNLQYITLGCLDDGTNELSTKSLMSQVLFCFILFLDLGNSKLFIFTGIPRLVRFQLVRFSI